MSWDMSEYSVASCDIDAYKMRTYERHISHALMLSHSIYEYYTNTMSIILTLIVNQPENNTI
jgi:hypothetical protein